MQRSDLDKLDEDAPVKRKKRAEKPSGSLSMSSLTSTKIWNAFSIGFIGAVVGSLFTLMISSYAGSNKLGTEYRKNLEYRNSLAAIEGVINAGGSIGPESKNDVDPTSREYRTVSLKGITSKKDLRRAITYTSLLKGVKRLNLENSAADDSIMQDIQANFKTLEYLNINNTKVTMLSSLANLGIVELHLNKAPIEDDQFRVIGGMQGLQRLTLGPALQVDANHRFPIRTIALSLVDNSTLWDVVINSTNDDHVLDEATKSTLLERKPADASERRQQEYGD